MKSNTAKTHSRAIVLTTRTLLAVAALLLITAPTVHAVPRAAKWSTKSLGPDGPWNALEITMGKGQTVTTYAGKMWESFFLDSDYCNATASKGANGKQLPCYAKQAGAIYNESAGTGTKIPATSDKPGTYFSGAMDSSAGPSKNNGPDRYRDDFHLASDTKQWAADTVSNLDMVLLSETQLKYPGGDLYPLFAGCLGLGAAPGMVVNHTYNKGSSSSNANSVNMSLVAGAYAKQGYTDSNSFGMHIGSAIPSPSSPKKKMLEGSLFFGGYDKNRVIGDVLAIPIPQPYVLFDGLPLVDISINVIKGGSPFAGDNGNGWRSKAGYLAAGNATMGPSSQLNVRLDGCAPYLNLPKSTCDALAADLPVTYSPKLGLYVWNTESPDYARIVSSATALTFTFLDPDNNAHRMNVSVPFAHLNLTLDAPLVDKPTPYFPCNAVAAGAHYALGRAFLQDAFLGASFDRGVFFLAQAPGPNIASVDGIANTNAVAMGSKTLTPSNNDWKTSWEGAWTPLPGGDGEENDPTTKASGNGSDDGGNGDGSAVTHNVGLIAGLAVGVGGGVSVLALAAFVAYRRHKSGKGFACCGLRIVKDKDKYEPAAPGSPNPQNQQHQQQEEEEAYKHPEYYRHELPLNEAVTYSQQQQELPVIQISSPTETGETRPGSKDHGETPSQRQVFEMAGDEDYQKRQ
ncbi:aspartic peptidase domain-containing protein [Apiospora arundinis]